MADDPTVDVSVVAAPTSEAPAVDGEEVPTSTWTVDHLATRFRALSPVTTRKARGVDRDEAEKLFEAMAETISALERRVTAEVHARKRVAVDRAKLRELNAQLVEQLGDRNEARPPARAVAEVKGATLAAERSAEAIEAEARQRAAQIIEDARTRAAALLAGVEPPPVTGDEPTDFAAEAEWLTVALPETERRLIELRERKAGLLNLAAEKQAEMERRQAEIDRWNGVLPLVQAQLPAAAIEVAEIEVAS